DRVRALRFGEMERRGVVRPSIACVRDVREPVTELVSEDGEHASAFELREPAADELDRDRRLVHETPIAIEFVGGWLTKLERGGMLAVFGHELGHWLAHVANARYRWAYDAASLHLTETQRAYAI